MCTMYTVHIFIVGIDHVKALNMKNISRILCEFLIVNTDHPSAALCISHILPIRKNSFLQNSKRIRICTFFALCENIRFVYILSNLEEAVVRPDREVVRLRDVVQQGPEVLDGVKGRHLGHQVI